jgi:hypothetical protein
MLFRQRWQQSKIVISVLGLFMLTQFSGCGLFGKKKEASKTLSSGKDLGCLDTLNTKVKGFSEGTISDSEWSTTFDCINEQITFFKSYVKGNGLNDSYNRGDIGSLTRDFLIKKHSVTDQFIQSLFDLKAAIVGGGIDYITPQELDIFSELMTFLKKESLAILPYVRAHHDAPTTVTALKLADAITVLGNHAEAYLSKRVGNHSIDKDSFIPFAKELLTLADGKVDMVDEYEELIRSVKVLIFGGDKNLIEPWAWPKLARDFTAFYGVYNGYLRIDGNSDRGEVTDFNFQSASDRDEYILALLQRGRSHLMRILEMNGGSIGLDRVNSVIDALPRDFIQNQKRLAIKGDLPAILKNVLGAKINRAVDTTALRTAMNIFEDGYLGQIWVKKLYQNLDIHKATAAQFEREAQRALMGSISSADRVALNDLIHVAKTFVGLFPQDSSRMLFNYETRAVRTENNMIMMQWFRKAMRHIFVSYATGPNGVAQIKDLVQLSQDFGNSLKAFGKFSPDVSYQEIAEKRFREGNLFMPNSNGDKYFDEFEGTYYLAFLFSSGSTTSRTWNFLTDDWKLCQPRFVDEIGMPAMEVGCFRDGFYKNLDKIWVGVPKMEAAYNAMSTSERSDFVRHMETAGRKSGYSNLPLGEYDIDSISAIPHYVESMMFRFDLNRDNIVDRDELIDHAFPVFREALKAIPGVPKGDLFLQSALTYVVKYGQVPSTAQFLKWHMKRVVLGRRAWRSVVTDRAALYRVLAVLAEAL